MLFTEKNAMVPGRILGEDASSKDRLTAHETICLNLTPQCDLQVFALHPLYLSLDALTSKQVEHLFSKSVAISVAHFEFEL